MADGQPQSTVVWCNVEGPYVLLNTMRGYQKEKNMRRNPLVTIFCHDPCNPFHNVEVRGRVVEMTELGAAEHNDRLTMLYLGKPHFFGDAVPAEFAARFTPVICRVLPTRVRVEDGRAPAPPAHSDAAKAPALRSAMGSAQEGTAIPQSHYDLLGRPVYAVLTTMMPDGQPQSSLVWWDYDGEHVLLSTSLERQKGRNMTANSKVALLVIDPANSSRYIEVRGEAVEMSTAGAVELADRLTRRYTGKQRFYGDIYAAEKQFQETRVVCRIRLRKVNVDAIFK
jgi:PPOX class probable F420-dependent enzyme